MNIVSEEIQLNPGAAQAEDVVVEPFQTAEIVTVAAAHGAHDTYFSYLPTILPLLIQNLALNTTQAGLLSACSQIPNLLQPVIGYLADRTNLKLLVILAPTFSGALITLVGVAPSFGVAALLLVLAGFSTAGFHSIAPAMISARAGQKVGRGMGFFVVGGELGFALGPLMVVATIGLLTITGLPWLMTLGMLASFILYFKLKNVTTVRHAQASGLPVREALRQMSGLILPLMAIIAVTGFLQANIVNYLPTFMSSEGAAFSLAGASLSVVQLGGTLGVLLMGLFSDRIGHRRIAIVGTLASVGFSLGFLFSAGWLQLIMLAGTGFSAFVANPAFLAMVQMRFPHNRSLANGMYMSSSFVLRSVVVVLVGVLADRFGMRPVFIGSSLVTLLALPIIYFMLPQKMKNRAAAIITRGGKLLVFLRRKPGREYYSLPGGSVQLEESFAAACAREVKEETGLDVLALELVLKYVSPEKEEQFFHVIVPPEAPVLGGPEALHNSPENYYEFAWVDAAQLASIDLAPASARRACLEVLQRTNPGKL